MPARRLGCLKVLALCSGALCSLTLCSLTLCSLTLCSLTLCSLTLCSSAHGQDFSSSARPVPVAVAPPPAKDVPSFARELIVRRDASLPVESDGQPTLHAPPKAAPPIKLSPPSAPGERQLDSRPAKGLTGPFSSMISGLAIVLGLFFLLAWFARRNQPGGNALLPNEVVQTLGRAQLSGRHQMHVVQFGGKLLLVSTAPNGVETLSEITDAEEVERLTGICRQQQPESATKTFRQILQQIGREPTDDAFVDSQPNPQWGSTNPSRNVEGSLRPRSN